MKRREFIQAIGGAALLPCIPALGEKAPVPLKFEPPSVQPDVVLATTTMEQTFHIEGIKASDVVLAMSGGIHPSGLGIITSRVVGEGKVAMLFLNTRKIAILPARVGLVVLSREGK